MAIEQFVKHIEHLSEQHQQSLDRETSSLSRVAQLRSELVKLKDMLKLALEQKQT
jgi:hypothetical protein